MPDAGAVAPERRPGRPRSAQADEAILDAAIDAFIDVGWDGLSVEDVAARAGVAKTTIYRRYPARIDLILAAAERLAEEKGAAPDTGTLCGDLRALVDAYVGMLTGTRAGRAIPDDGGRDGAEPGARASPTAAFIAGAPARSRGAVGARDRSGVSCRSTSIRTW